MTALTRKAVVRIRDEIAAAHGDATANCFVRVASAMFTWAVEREWLDVNPVVRIRPFEGGHLRAWTAAEYARIVPRLPEPLRRAAVLARYTGQRRGDLIAMRWSQYDGRLIRLTQQKTGKELVIPVAAALRADLNAWRSGPVTPHPDRPILITRSGGVWTGPHLGAVVLACAAGYRAGRGRAVPAWVPELCAAALVEAGCSEHEAAAITGHDDMSTLRLYTRSARQEQLAYAAIARLDIAGAKNRLT